MGTLDDADADIDADARLEVVRRGAESWRRENEYRVKIMDECARAYAEAAWRHILPTVRVKNSMRIQWGWAVHLRSDGDEPADSIVVSSSGDWIWVYERRISGWFGDRFELRPHPSLPYRAAPTISTAAIVDSFTASLTHAIMHR